MKKSVFAILLFLVLTGSCSRQPDQVKDSFEYFSTHLKADMSYPTIVNLFGAPDKDIGSGIHIYVYNLADGSAVWIGYTDKILYAKHVNSAGQMLHNII